MEEGQEEITKTKVVQELPAQSVEELKLDDQVEDEVDLYDDVLSLPTGNQDGEDLEESSSPTNAESNSTTNNITRVHSTINHNHNESDVRGDRDREQHEYKDSIAPLRKYQVYVGNLTWWTTDQDINDAMIEIGVKDFIDVKFYDNRTNGQSKGYCVLAVGSSASLKLIHEKLSKKELHGQFPVITPPTKQNLNHFEAQSKSRPSQSGGGGGGQGMGNGGGRGGMEPGPGNMGMNMMGGPRGPGPMPMQMQGQMGMGYGGGPSGPGPGPRMMMGPGGQGHMFGPRGMPPMGPGPGAMPVRGMMGPQHHGGPQGYGPPQPQQHQAPQQQQHQGPPQNSMPPAPGGPRMPGMMHGGPPGPGPMSRMPSGMMHPRGPHHHEWERPPMNNYIPHGQGPPMSMPRPPDLRGQALPPPGPMTGPPQSAPAPHMNPAFFRNIGGLPSAPVTSFNSSEPQVGGYHPPAMSESEFDEVMGRNRTVSSSAISRAVSDAATGDFASAIETLVTAISLIKQSKVASDDRCMILVSSLQDTLRGVEAKSYGSGGGRRERSRSRSPPRHRRTRRERTRSRSRESYRDKSRDHDRERYHEYPIEEAPKGREEREREYRERPRDDSSRAYYDERYRERDREHDRSHDRGRDREHDRERDKERGPRIDRDRELERDLPREPSHAHRGPRH